jgi:hypothetical protein
MNLPPLRIAFLLTLFVLSCFALSRRAQAVCQEGSVRNGNTAIGEDAIIITPAARTQRMVFTLFSNTIGNSNTATGADTLL